MPFFFFFFNLLRTHSFSLCLSFSLSVFIYLSIYIWLFLSHSSRHRVECFRWLKYKYRARSPTEVKWKMNRTMIPFQCAANWKQNEENQPKTHLRFDYSGFVRKITFSTPNKITATKSNRNRTKWMWLKTMNINWFAANKKIICIIRWEVVIDELSKTNTSSQTNAERFRVNRSILFKIQFSIGNLTNDIENWRQYQYR